LRFVVANLFGNSMSSTMSISRAAQSEFDATVPAASARTSPVGDEDRGVSATVVDWTRETPTAFWQPARKLMAAMRDYQRHVSQPVALSPILKRIAVLRHRFWSVISGADIPLNARIGGGLLMPHPNGIVISHLAVVGPNCLLFHQVTLGTGGPIPGAPTLGGHVDVGAGAKILGGVKIGDHAQIGANAVVLHDVPPGATAIGIPARIL
jgi:serine O-acetyltransferase